jgi:hypothetical protein
LNRIAATSKSCAIAKLRAPLIIAARRGRAAIVMTLIIAGCASAPPGSSGPTAAVAQVLSLFSGDQQTLTSFLGVKFGDTLSHVQQRIPDGQVLSAPFGADVYSLDTYAVGSIVWERVIFEFTDRTGMQLVMARFSAPSSDTVFEMLQKAIGPPTRTRQGTGASPATLYAMWELPHGERVSFDGPNRLVAVVGPAGGPLRQDIELSRANGLI